MTTAIASNAIFFSHSDRDAGPAARSRLRLASSSSANEQRANPPVHLTRRQREVLALLCEGLPNKLICRRLEIAPGTAKAHISSILRELGVASRLQAVVAARRYGLLDTGLEEEGEPGGSAAAEVANFAGSRRLGRQPS
jgi:DNA-binding CsgD family transcriptional regulator